MGYRTVVVLFNDKSSEWQNDPKLGEKIVHGMNRIGDPKADLGYGRIVECTHADTQTLAVLDSYNFITVAHDHWTRNEKPEELSLKLLKEAANKLGYKLVKNAK